MKKKPLTILLSVFMLMSTFTTNVFAEGNVAKIDSTEYETLVDAIAAAETDDIVEVIAKGEYTLPSIQKNITIKATIDDVIIDATAGGNICAVPNGVTFENLCFNFGNSSYHGFQHAGNIVFNLCTLKGLLFSYGDIVFNNCNFIQTTSEYMMWNYAGNQTYNDCTFTGKGKFLHLYNEGNSLDNVNGSKLPWVVKVNNCTFNSDTKNKSAINVKESCGNIPLQYHLYIDSNTTTNENFPTDEIGRRKVFMIDDLLDVPEKDIVVYLDETQVYPILIDPVAKIEETTYVNLQDALNNLPDDDIYSYPTIEILKDIDDAKGVKIDTGKRCAIDFGNHTYTIKKADTNTESSAFLIKNNAIVEFKNGTIGLDVNNSTISTVIKNCGDMKLDNMNVIGIKVVKINDDKRVITNKCGNTLITNGTNVIANSGDIAIDTCKDDAFVFNAQVIIDNANVAGNIEVDGGILDFKEGKLLGKIIDTKKASNLIVVYDGLFSDAIDNDYIIEGKTCVANEDSETNLAYPYTIDTKIETEIGTNAKQENNENPVVNNKIEEANKQAAQEIAAAVKSSKVDLLPEAKTMANNPNIVTENIVEKAKSNEVVQALEASSTDEIEIVVETKLVQEIVEVKKNESELKSFKVDIVPVYEIKAINTTKDKTVSLSNSKVLTVNREIYIRINLPDVFGNADDTVWVKHYLHDGSSKVYDAIITIDETGKYIEFNNPDGFSVFELSLEELAPDSKPVPTPAPDSRPRYKVPKTGVEGTANIHSLLKLSSLSLLAVGTYMVIKKKKDN